MKFVTIPFLFLLSSASSFAAPVCQNTTDPDGDGWGWENNQSCEMPASASTTNTTTTTGTSNDLTLSTLLGQCIAELAGQDNSGNAAPDPNCVDTAPIGDGWGWNGSTSCKVAASNSTTAQQCTTNNSGNNNGSQGGQYGTGYTDYTNAQPTCEEASDRILRLVTAGMHESEVLRLVGKPRDVSTSGSSYLYWDYSTRAYSNYPRITFNQSARTVRTFAVNTETCG